MTSEVLLLGEALIDVVQGAADAGDPVPPATEHVGGSVLNVAVGVAELGTSAQLATWIGPDDRGERIANHAAAHRVSLAPGSMQAAATPIALATVDPQGVASYQFVLEWRLPELDFPVSAGHLHTGSFAATLAPGADQVLAAIQRGRATATVSYDPNIRPALMGTPEQVRDRIEALVGLSDLVKVSDEDLAWLYPGQEAEQVARRWLATGPALVVVTLGGEGALAVAPAGELRIDPVRVPVGDTVGAGDSFMAGLLTALLEDDLLGSRQAAQRLRVASADQLTAALGRATAAAALTVQRVGAYSPSRAELGLS